MGDEIGWVVVGCFAITLAVLATIDPLWAGDPGSRVIAFASWLAMPIGVFAAGNFVDGATDVTRYSLLAGLPWIVVASWGRPALLMRDAWPETASNDTDLIRRSNRRTAVLIGGVVFGAAAAGAFALGGYG